MHVYHPRFRHQQSSSLFSMLLPYGAYLKILTFYLYGVELLKQMNGKTMSPQDLPSRVESTMSQNSPQYQGPIYIVGLVGCGMGHKMVVGCRMQEILRAR